MRWSSYLAPTFKETPAEAHIKSHQLLLQGGFIHFVTGGIYGWLPLGLRVLRRIEAIVRQEQDRAGAQEMLMPTIQPAEVWRASGRYDDYGKEMLRFHDRHEREILYGPTAEELFTECARLYIRSYRDVPKILYNIQWKFRDEIRPRFGVMRGREFLMKDAYSFDIDEAHARKAYETMFDAYCRTFARLGVKAIPVRAPTGPIGGDLSHEFHILAPTGESTIYYDPRFGQHDGMSAPPKDWAAFEETQVPQNIEISTLLSHKSIEVGHIFYFGMKYSQALKALIALRSGESMPLYMGSYGIGVSRLVGAIVEACHDDQGIVWPEAVAPFDVGLIALQGQECQEVAEKMYESLRHQGFDVLFDDRQERSGIKFADMDLIGLPLQIIVGPQNCAKGCVEIKERRLGVKHVLGMEEAWNFFLQRRSS